jgi:hypothetical protein
MGGVSSVLWLVLGDVADAVAGRTGAEGTPHAAAHACGFHHAWKAGSPAALGAPAMTGLRTSRELLLLGRT